MNISEVLSNNLNEVKKGEKQLWEFYSFLWKNAALLNSYQFRDILAEIKEKACDSEIGKCWYTLTECILYSFSPDIGNPFEKISEAIGQFRQINEKAGEGAAQALLVVYFKNLGQLDKAQECVQKAIDAIGNSKTYSYFLIVNYFQAGEVHHILRDYETAIDYYNKAIAISEATDNIAARMLNGLATVYMDMKQLDVAHEYFKKSLQQSKDNNNFLLESKNYADIGNYHGLKGDYEKALAFQQKSLELRLEKRLSNPIITNYIVLAELFLKQNKLAEALDYALLAQKLAAELKIIIKILQVHRVLSSVYEAMGNTSLALEHFKKFHQYNEEVHNQESARKIKQLSMFHEVENAQKEKEIFRLRNVELKSALDDIHASVRYAKHIQNAILPPARLVKEYLPDSFVLYKPKDIVAGDFYWIEKIGEQLFFAAADCTGHGVPGAMVSVICSNALNSAVKEFKLTTPSDILNKARELVIEQFEKSDEEVKDGMDISLCVINTKTNMLEWAGANNPLWIINKGELIEYKPDKQPVGKHPESKPFTNYQISINKGDRMYIFTDGFADQFGGTDGKKFKGSALRKLLLDMQEESMTKQYSVIENAFNNWKGSLQQVDDVCLIGVQY